jgi:hypothetical protein
VAILAVIIQLFRRVHPWDCPGHLDLCLSWLREDPMNLALTYTIDALRMVQEDIKSLQDDAYRIAERKAKLECRRDSLLAQLEFHKANKHL